MTLRYTKEELLAIRASLSVETLKDPIPPNCALRTDCNVRVYQTIVRKRQKEAVVQLRQYPIPSISYTYTHKIPSVTLQPMNSADGFRVNNTRPRTVMTNPTQTVVRRNTVTTTATTPHPCVSGMMEAARSVRHPVRKCHLSQPFTPPAVNLMAERQLLLMVRGYQLQIQQIQMQRQHRMCSTFGVRRVADGGMATMNTGMLRAPPPVSGARLFSDSAVPFMNVSQIKNILDSQCSPLAHRPNFLRQLIFPWPVMPSPAVVTSGQPSGETNPSSGQQSSIGLDESGATPTKEEEESVHKVVKPKHRRRTNRTHAEKRGARLVKESHLQEVNANREIVILKDKSASCA